MKLKFLFFALVLLMVSCTENETSKGFGGKMTINLPPGQKLENATWKEKQIWYLTRPAEPGETPTTYTFKEKSNWGVLEGEIIFIEH